MKFLFASLAVLLSFGTHANDLQLNPDEVLTVTSHESSVRIVINHPGEASGICGVRLYRTSSPLKNLFNFVKLEGNFHLVRNFFIYVDLLESRGQDTAFVTLTSRNGKGLDENIREALAGGELYAKPAACP